MTDELPDTPYEPREDEAFFKVLINDKQKEYCNDNIVLAKLLIDNVVFVGDFDTGPFFGSNKEDRKPEVTTCVWVNCNDVFYWGTADCECVLTKELPELYRMYMADKKYGSLKWVCKKRLQKPQAAYIKEMKEQGAWDDMMENLPNK